MRNISSATIHFLFLLLIGFYSCNAQEKPKTEGEIKFFEVEPPTELQIADYVRNIYQDKAGNLWFGTNGYGVAHYDGENVSYFSNAQGFNGQQVTGITEDKAHNLWFATDQGIVKYHWSSNEKDIKQFTNYSGKEYFGGQRFWSIFADSKNNIWGGSVKEIFRFDGAKWASFNEADWAPFKLPFGQEMSGDFITKGTTWSINEDSDSNMWFSTNGAGAFKFDGQSFTQYTKEDGLTDNSVDNIMQDSKGNMWFGTRFGGVSRFDGKTFTNFTSRDSIGNDEVCVIFEDSKGHIWMSSEGYGVYRFDGNVFSNYSEAEGLGVRAVQTIFEDREGRIWVGGGGGLYRFENGTFINVKRDGPWQ